MVYLLDCTYVTLFLYIICLHVSRGETDNHSPNGMSKYLVMNHDTKHTYSICYPVEDFCLSIIQNTRINSKYSTCRDE